MDDVFVSTPKTTERRRDTHYCLYGDRFPVCPKHIYTGKSATVTLVEKHCRTYIVSFRLRRGYTTVHNSLHTAIALAR